MSIITLIIIAVAVIILVRWVIDFFSMLLNDFGEKVLNETLWLWLPIRAFGRLVKEYREKHGK